ncbi:MAG: hypothetical protein M1365_09765, partial [Actinobacteria bacterium]|nr:hypothetical protein [Actinomycetota bacterium]
MSIETMEESVASESEIKPSLIESKKIDNGFKGEFYVTDHRPDYPEATEDDLRAHYKDIKRDGVDSVRFDFRWSLIEAQRGRTNEAQLKKYADVAKIMHEVGLKEPTIILSSLPSWAKELYRTNKEEFFTKFGEFATNIRNAICLVGGKPETVQVLNELNNPAYTPITDLQGIGRLCDIAKKVFCPRKT